MIVRIAQVNCVLDPWRRDPEALLTACQALPAIRGDGRCGCRGRGSPASHAEARFTRCDLLLATSHRESSAYALIEALACGLPPMCSDIAPLRALVGDLAERCFARSARK